MSTQNTATNRDRTLAGMLDVAAAFVHDEPSEAALLELAEAGLFAEVPAGFSDEALTDGFGLLDGALASLAGMEDEDRASTIAALQREWLRLFVGVGEPQVPSWANFYLDPESRMLGRASLKVRELYRAYGLQVQGMNRTPDDDLGHMLRFLGRLVSLECDALEAGDGDRAERIRADETELLRGYILPWLDAWRYAGGKHASSGLYRGVVETVYGTIRSLAATLNFEHDAEKSAFVLRRAA